MYEINLCSPIYHVTPASGFNVRVVRFLLLSNLILLFLMYIIILVFLKKSIHNLKSESEDNGRKLQDKQNFLRVL